MRALWRAVAAALLLAGCDPGSVRPFTYNDGKEMAGRPGLFTGPAGAIEVYRR